MDRIHLLAGGHGFLEGAAVVIKLVDRIKELLIGNLFFFKNHTVALFFKRTGIQDLVTAACIG